MTPDTGHARDPGALDPQHPIVFRRTYVRWASRLQWILLALGALLLLLAGIWLPVQLLTPIPPLAGVLALIGAAALLLGVVWARLWRRNLRKSWWGDRYGSWF